MPEDTNETPKQSLDGMTNKVGVNNNEKKGDETAASSSWGEPTEASTTEIQKVEQEIDKVETETETTLGSATAQEGAVGTTESTVPAVSAAPAGAASFGAKPKSKKKLIIAIVAAVSAVALIAGGVSAYMWHQNPDKMLGDAAMNLFTAKSMTADGTMALASEAADVKVEYRSKGTNEKSDANIVVNVTPKGEYASIGAMKLTADGVVDKDGTIYFKLGNVKSTLEKAVGAYVNMMVASEPTATPAQIGQVKNEVVKKLTPIADELDNKWVKITPEDMKENNGTENYTCIRDLGKKLESDKAMRSELTKTYESHRFIKIEKRLGNKDGNVGFELGADKTKAQSFAKAVKDTAFGKAMQKCDGKAFDSSDDSAASDSKMTGKVEVWIGEWSHTLNRVVMNGDDKSSNTKVDVAMNMKYNTNPNVDIPTGAKSIKEVSERIQKLVGDMYGSSATPATSSSSSSMKLST